MEDTEETSYFDQCVGCEIMAIHDDSGSVWLHLSDGSALEFFALPDGGFDFDIHPAETSH